MNSGCWHLCNKVLKDFNNKNMADMYILYLDSKTRLYTLSSCFYKFHDKIGFGFQEVILPKTIKRHWSTSSVFQFLYTSDEHENHSKLIEDEVIIFSTKHLHLFYCQGKDLDFFEQEMSQYTKDLYLTYKEDKLSSVKLKVNKVYNIEQIKEYINELEIEHRYSEWYNDVEYLRKASAYAANQ